MRITKKTFILLSFTAGVLANTTTHTHAQGVVFRGMGAINESMGGAGIAAPLDSAGAIYTNPATLSGLQENEVAFGLGVLDPSSSVTSEVVGMPSTHGHTKNRREVYYCPSFSVARHVGTNWTFGFSVGAIGGASAHYSAPQTGTNPIVGAAGRSAKVKIIELMPTASYAFTKRISAGVTPVVGGFSLFVDPMPFGRPATAPLSPSNTDYTFGGGVNLGLYFDPGHNFKTGFVVKSPVWAEPFKFTGADTTPGSVGQYRTQEYSFSTPLIVGWGISYDGVKDLLLAFDVRYFDYSNAKGFRPASVYDSQGRVGGLGWKSIFSVALGAQYAVTENFKIRAGYCFSENPIPGKIQFANVASPLFIQHVASLGLTYSFSTGTDISVTWSHAFENKCGGLTPDGRVRVANSVQAETLFIGVTQRF